MIRQEHIQRLRCGNVGWNSVKNAYDYASPSFELRQDAGRFESGSANMVGLWALSASVEMFLRIGEHHGPHAIAQRVVDLVERLDQSLRREGAHTRLPRSPSNRSGILTFEVPGVEPSEIRKRALEEKVVVSCRDGGVRASVHAYNDAEDLRRLVDVVRSCSRSQRN